MSSISAFLGRRRFLLGLALVALTLAFGIFWLWPLDLRPRLEEGLAQAIGTPVHIRVLRWRGLSAVTLEGITAGPAGETVVGLDRLHLVGSPWALLRRRIALDTLEIAGLRIRLRRDARGLWNLPILNTPTAGWPGWSVEVGRGTLASGSFEVAGSSRVRMDSLNAEFEVRNRDGAHAFHLTCQDALVGFPPLAIRRVDADMSLRKDTLEISGVELTTEGSHLRLTGRVVNLGDPRMDLSLASERLSTEEVRRFFPSIPEVGILGLNASLKGGRTGLDLVAALDTPGGHLDGRGVVQPDQTPPGYDLSITGQRLDLSRLLPGVGPLTALNLSLSLSGSGLTPGDADLSASLVGSGSRIGETIFDSLSTHLRMKDGRVEAEGVAQVAGIGKVRAEGGLDLSSQPRRYRMDADVEGLDLAAATGNAAWRSQLSGRVEVSGSGSEMDSLDLEGRIGLGPSRVGGLRVEDAEALGRLRYRVLTLDSLVVRGPAGAGRAVGQVLFPKDRAPTYGGSVDLTGLDLAAVTGESAFRSELNLKAEVAGDGADEVVLRLEGRPSRIAGEAIRRLEGEGGIRDGIWNVDRFDLESTAGEVHLTGPAGLSDSLYIRADVTVDHLPSELAPGFALSGRASGAARGRPGNLHLTASGRADSIRAGKTLLKDATFNLDFRDLDAGRPDAGIRTAASGDLTARIESARLAGFLVRDIIAAVHLTPGVADLALDIAPADRARVDVAGRVTFEPEGLVARLDTLFVDAERIRVRNEGPCQLRYAYGGGLRLDHLRIAQEGGALTAAGQVDANGDIRGEARLDGIDLARWEVLLGRKDGIGGRLSLLAAASGRAGSPEVTGSVEISDGRVADFVYRKLAGTFAYRDGVGRADLRLDQGGEGEGSAARGMTLRGWFPIPAREEAEFSVQAQSDGLELSFLQAAFPGLREVKGSLQGRLDLSGTVGRPVLTGFLEVPSGSLRVPDMGLRLTEIRVRVEAEPGRLRIGDMSLKTRGGSLTMEGDVSLDGMTVKDFDMGLKAATFDLLDQKDSQLNFSGTLRARGTPRDPDVNLDFTIHRALLPIPEEASETGSSPYWDSPFIRGMTGHGRLRIPRNAWVRSADFNVEVQGEVEVTKEAGSGFLFFGGLDATRGQYLFQNARFSIDRGELRFRGTPDNDPDLYLLGTRRIPRVLPDASGSPSQDLLIRIVVGGTLNKPKITLESDAPTPLDQADLLSYLLFGRPSSQTLLGSLGGGGTTANLQSQAQNLAFGIAANRLKQTVGRELGLDVLEVEVGQGKETFTHLAVGKYVSRDLLLTFSQDVIEAGGQGQDRLGRKVSVEYELGRSFGVSGSVDDQGNSALDLFWKKEW